MSPPARARLVLVVVVGSGSGSFGSISNSGAISPGVISLFGGSRSMMSRDGEGVGVELVLGLGSTAIGSPFLSPKNLITFKMPLVMPPIPARNVTDRKIMLRIFFNEFVCEITCDTWVIGLL